MHTMTTNSYVDKINFGSRFPTVGLTYLRILSYVKKCAAGVHIQQKPSRVMQFDFILGWAKHGKIAVLPTITEASC